MIKDTFFGEGAVCAASEASTTSGECMCLGAPCSCTTCDLASTRDALTQIMLAPTQSVSQ